MHYYNEIEPYCAEWLRNLIAADLIPNGHVDTRDIQDVLPSDLAGYTSCHFFAGLGGWAYALRLAGWPDDRPVWTGSCPCQKHSSAARGRNVAPDLWPSFEQLVAANKPSVVFGEQVANARRWFDGVCDDLEVLGYAVGAAILPACSVGFDHARERIFYVGDTDSHGESRLSVNAETRWMSRNQGDAGRMAAADGISSRVGRLRAYGNAIVPQVAAEFIRAYCETRGLA